MRIIIQTSQPSRQIKQNLTKIDARTFIGIIDQATLSAIRKSMTGKTWAIVEMQRKQWKIVMQSNSDAE